MAYPAFCLNLSMMHRERWLTGVSDFSECWKYPCPPPPPTTTIPPCPSARNVKLLGPCSLKWVKVKLTKLHTWWECWVGKPGGFAECVCCLRVCLKRCCESFGGAQVGRLWTAARCFCELTKVLSMWQVPSSFCCFLFSFPSSVFLPLVHPSFVFVSFFLFLFFLSLSLSLSLCLFFSPIFWQPGWAL